MSDQEGVMMSPIAVICAQLGPDWVDSYIPADDAHLMRHQPSGLWTYLDDEQINALDRVGLVELVGALRAVVAEGRQGGQVVSFESRTTSQGHRETTIRVLSRVGHGG